MKFIDFKCKCTSFLLRHRAEFTIFVVIIYILVTFGIYTFFPSDDESIRSPLERLSQSAEIASLFFIVISSVIAVFQYYISCRNDHIKSKNEKIQKSIDLIKYYKDNIIHKSAVIKSIFNSSKITDILNGIPKDKMKEFDEAELSQLLTADKIKQLKELQKSDIFIETVLFANEIYNLNLPGSNGEDMEKINITKMMNAFMSDFICGVLNDLEYFAMHFSHNIADHSVIFQSTHQSYLEITELLYYIIADYNKMGGSNYYTNLIELHNVWKKKQLESREQNIKNQRGSIQKGSCAENIDI